MTRTKSQFNSIQLDPIATSSLPTPNYTLFRIRNQQPSIATRLQYAENHGMLQNIAKAWTIISLTNPITNNNLSNKHTLILLKTTNLEKKTLLKIRYTNPLTLKQCQSNSLQTRCTSSHCQFSFIDAHLTG